MMELKIRNMYAIIADNGLESRISSVISDKDIALKNIEELNRTDKYGDYFKIEKVQVFDYE